MTQPHTNTEGTAPRPAAPGADGSPLVRAARGLEVTVGVYALAAVGLLGAQVRQSVQLQELINGGFVDYTLADGRDRGAWTLGMVALGASGLVLVALARWLFVAYTVAARRGIRGLAATPWGAALSLFVPVLNLVRPYQHVLRLAAALRKPGGTRGEVRLRPDAERGGYRARAAEVVRPAGEPPSASQIFVWGALWGGGRLLATLAATLSTPQGDPAAMQQRVGLAMLGGLLGLGAAWLTRGVTRDLTGALIDQGEDKASAGGDGF